MFLLTVLLAVIWVALTGEFSPANFFVGLVAASGIIGLTQEMSGRRSYWRRVAKAVSFILYLLKEVLVASLRVAAVVLSPKLSITPGVIAVPLALKSDIEITLLANVITLTPGTLSLDVSDDHRFIYVHTIDFKDAETFRADIKNGFERRIQELFAP